MMDNPDLSEYVKNKATPMVLSGLKKTMEELTSKILYRPIRSSIEDVVSSSQKSVVKDDDEYFGPEILMESSDDIAASVSDAVKSASDLVFIIYNRIAQMENPEEAKKQKVENQIIPSIAERYAKNR